MVSLETRWRCVELRTTFTDDTISRTANIRYLVVNAPSAYNILLGMLGSIVSKFKRGSELSF